MDGIDATRTGGIVTGPVVLFLGPSLSHEDARAVLPEAICLPPAAMGDVLGATLTHRPHAIGLVDGTFLSTMSVFHKELLFAMEQGAWVLGSSSMGALRAAECARFGMIGVGGIYEALASGTIEDDDEVALTHGGVDVDYRALSDAFVTIRASVEAAASAGLLSSDEAAHLVAQQKSRWFPERRLSGVPADAAAYGMPAERVDELRSFLRTRAVDPKREDALMLLERIRTLPSTPMPVDERPTTARSGVFAATLARDVKVSTPEGMSVTFDRIRRHAALHDPQFAVDMRTARLSMAAAQLSRWLGGPPTDEEREDARRRLQERLGLDSDGFEAWAIEQDLGPNDLAVLLGTDAVLWRLERTWLGRAQYGVITTPYLNHLRVTGRYTRLKAAAALEHATAQGVSLSPEPSARAVVMSMAALGSWRIPADFDEYIDDADLGSMLELIQAMTVAIKAHQALLGVGLVPEDDTLVLVDDLEPMMSRGR